MSELTREDIECRMPMAHPESLEYAALAMALRTHDAEQRAELAEADLDGYKRAAERWWGHYKQTEAENARLRAALREQECTHWGGGRNVGDCMADGDCHEGCTQAEALATPPEGEKCSHARVQGNGSEYMCVDCGHRFTTMFDRDATHAPQQPEDALAALERLCNEYDVPDNDEYYAVRRHLTQSNGHANSIRIIRQMVGLPDESPDGGNDLLDKMRHLTASAVPYVPEQIRRLPHHFRAITGQVDDDGGNAQVREAYEHCADMTERALASAPAVPDYNDEQIIAACKAHDKEVAAQMGEPSPWDVVDDLCPMEQWRSGRIVAMRAALAAIATAPTKGGTE